MNRIRTDRMFMMNLILIEYVPALTTRITPVLKKGRAGLTFTRRVV